MKQEKPNFVRTPREDWIQLEKVIKFRVDTIGPGEWGFYMVTGKDKNKCIIEYWISENYPTPSEAQKALDNWMKSLGYKK